MHVLKVLLIVAVSAFVACEQEASSSLPKQNPEFEDLAEQAIGVYERLSTKLLYVPQSSIDQVLRGELDERNLLGLTQWEYEGLIAEIRQIGERGMELNLPVPEDTEQSEKAVSCRRWAYGGCLIAAGIGATFAPYGAAVVYFTAGYLCYCGYCSGPEVEAVCG